MQIVFIIIGVIALVAALAGFAYWSDRKRREELQNLALEMGLEFHSDGSDVLQHELSAFKLFSTGRSRKLTKLILGESDEVTISIFDYCYTTGSGKQSHTYQQSVAALQSEQLLIPDFTLRAENMLDKIGGLIGLEDIDFDSHPKFSGMFVLKGSSEPAVRKLFTPSIMTFFENRKGVSVEAIPGAIVLYRPGRRVSPKDIKAFLAEAYEVYGVLVDELQPA